MTKFWLIILRIICIIQLIIASFECILSFIGLFTDGDLIYILQTTAFAFIAALPVFTFNIINNNFPDKFIAGKQKRNFNRIFLVNFLLITFLFGFIFRDYRQAKVTADLASISVFKLPGFFLFGFLISVIMLVFHFILLFGLFWLRSHINFNAGNKQFDFESPNEGV
jgi:hypothetical protein